MSVYLASSHAQKAGLCLQEEAEAEYKKLFPDHDDTFAEYEAPPNAYGGVDAETGQQSSAEVVQSSAAQSLLHGQTLNEVAALQKRCLHRLKVS